MLSDRLYKMFSKVCHFGCKFGAFPIEFERSNLSFSISKRNVVSQRFSLKKHLAISWVAASFGIVLNEYFSGNLNKFMFKSVFTLLITFDNIMCSIVYLNLDDVVIFLNGMVILLENVRGKFKKHFV